jgi:hypothetical protein
MTDNATPLPPAGWYPDTQNPGAQRYWDGAAWTEHTAVPAPAPPASSAPTTVLIPEPALADGSIAAPAGTGLSRLKWWHWLLIGFGVLVLVSIIVNGVNGVNGGSADNTGADKPASVAEEAERPEINEPAEDTRPEVPSIVGKTVAEARTALEAEGFALVVSNGAPDHAIVETQDVANGEKRDPGASITVAASVPMTVAQESAIRSAKSYLSFTGFSRVGLSGQLTSEYGEGFAPEDAEFAIATLEQSGQVDWNQEAVQSAQSYIEMSGFSRSGLFDQLTSEYGEQYTADQANFALDTIGLH